MAQKEIKQWVTTKKGVRIPIYEGESISDAFNRMKAGARKGKDTAPTTREAVQKKKEEFHKAADKAHRKGKAFDDNPTQKRAEAYENADMERHYKAQQYKKEAAKHKIESTKFNNKSGSESGSVKEAVQSRGQKTLQKRNITDDITSARDVNELHKRLKAQGLDMDAADADTIRRDFRSINGDKVSLYDKDNNEYRGTFNRYNDGGTEIIGIKMSKKAKKDDDIDIKEKQIAKHTEAADKLNDKPTKQKKAMPESASKKSYTSSRSPKYYEWEAQKGHFSDSEEDEHLSNTQKHIAKIRDIKATGKKAIKEAKEAMKLYGPRRDMIQDVKKYDAAWEKVSGQFARGEINAEDYNTIYHMFGPRFHEGYKVRHRKKK